MNIYQPQSYLFSLSDIAYRPAWHGSPRKSALELQELQVDVTEPTKSRTPSVAGGGAYK